VDNKYNISPRLHGTYIDRYDTRGIIFYQGIGENGGEIWRGASHQNGTSDSPRRGYANARIRHHAPKVADEIEVGDKEILKDPALAQIPPEPILGEFVAAADAEPNAALQAKLPDVKAGRIVQVMASGIEGTNLKAKSMTQTAPRGSESVEQTMLKDVKVTGDIDLGDLSQG
jgi:hypothetical protein